MGQWICHSGDGRETRLAPVFRRPFEVKGGLRSAKLRITAHGIYEAEINGRSVAMFVAYIIISVIQARQASQSGHSQQSGELIPVPKTLVLLVVGAALIAVGAKLLVDNGTLLAQAAGVSEAVIGLTLVALGTSLPELITAVTSLVKGHSSLSLGNVIGANLFNLVLVSGVSVTLAPFEVPQGAEVMGINSSLLIDIPVMFLVMLILSVPAVIKGKLSRIQGVTLLLIYAGFCALRFCL